MWWFLLCIFVLSGCRSKSSDYFLEQGRKISLQLVQELEEIDDLEELVAELPKLERQFIQLAELMIQARRYQIKKKCSWEPSEDDLAVSRELAMALNRLYQIPGAKSLIEKSQEKALFKLDAHERKIALSKK